MRILVIYGFNNCSVATVRSLARAGHHVDVAVILARGRPRRLRYLVSRYARAVVILPHPREDLRAFGKSLIARCSEVKYDVVLPAGEESTLAVAAMQPDLDPYAATPLDQPAKVALVHDKRELHSTLQAAGFDVPRLYDYRHVDELASMDIAFPVVVKARKNSGARDGVRYVRDRDAMLSAVRDLEQRPSPHPEICDFSRPMIQEFIPGATHDADCLFCRGEKRAIMTSHRMVVYPSSGGVGVTTVTTHDPELAAYAERILSYLDWHGLCDLEVKKDARDGKYKLMEINPRLWGQLDLSIKAGIPFPAKACEMAVKGETAPVFDYRVGLRYTILFPRAVLSLAEPVKPRWPRFKETLKSLGPNGRIELDIRDPLPHVLELAKTAMMLVQQMRSRDVPHAPN